MIEYIKEDIEEVMEITGLDYGKAEKLFKSVAKDIDDGEDDEICSYDVIDVIRIEQKAQKNGIKNYVVGDKAEKKASKPRTVVTSDEKKQLFSNIFNNISEIYGENAKIEKENKLIIVKIADRTFKIDLIETRKPKKA